MKKFIWLFAGTFLLFNVFMITSCTEDPVEPPPPPPDVAPSLILSGTPTDPVLPGASFEFTITADAGSNALTSMTFSIDGSDLDNARLAIENIAIANNPQLISGSDKNGLVWVVTILAPEVEGTYVYGIRVSDDGSLTDEDSFTVTVEDPTTPIERELVGVLLNQAGPAGQGALDLDEGYSTGVTTPGAMAEPIDAEIRDMGIDTDLIPAENWRQQIGPMNDATMKFIDPTIVENFTFDVVTTREEIIGAFDNGTDLTLEVDGNAATDIVEEGDLYIVERAGTHYLIRIDLIEPTAADNNDQFTISIKY